MADAAPSLDTVAAPKADPVPAIITKRPHKKSRRGCISCKQRKVKCDEARPTCRSCRLRRTRCEYDAVALRKAAGSEKSLVPTADQMQVASVPKSVPGIDEPALCGLSIDRMDMKLLWFYTASTYKSLSYADDKQRSMNEMLQTVMVQHAFEAPFLMDSLLEMAVLHMQSLGQKVEPTQALVYRTRSIGGYRKAISDARPNSFAALLASSVFRPMLSAQVFRDPTSKSLYLLDWLLLWQGVSSVMTITSGASVEEYGLQSLFRRPPSDPDTSMAAIPKQLLLMVSFLGRDDKDAAELDTYQESLRALGSLFHGLRTGLDSVGVVRIVTWGSAIPPRLRELAQAGRPRALVILAYYATFLKVVQDIWWVAGVGDRSIRDICHVLDLEWHKYLKMPLAVLAIEKTKDLIPVILTAVEG